MLRAQFILDVKHVSTVLFLAIKGIKLVIFFQTVSGPNLVYFPLTKQYALTHQKQAVILTDFMYATLLFIFKRNQFMSHFW